MPHHLREIKIVNIQKAEFKDAPKSELKNDAAG